MLQDVRDYTAAITQAHSGQLSSCPPTALSTSHAVGGCVALTPFPSSSLLKGALQRQGAPTAEDTKWFTGAYPSCGGGELLLVVAPPHQEVGSEECGIFTCGASVLGMADLLVAQRAMRFDGHTGKWLVVESGASSSGAPLRPWAEQVSMLLEAISAGRCTVRSTSSEPWTWEVVAESDIPTTSGPRLRWYLPLRLVVVGSGKEGHHQHMNVSHTPFLQRLLVSNVMASHSQLVSRHLAVSAECTRQTTMNATLARELEDARSKLREVGGGGTDGGASSAFSGRREDVKASSSSSTTTTRNAVGPQVVSSIPQHRGKRTRGVKID